jgi:predicted transcriptional regulator
MKKMAVKELRPGQVNVRADDSLHDDLDKIAKHTKIRNRSDVVRYAVAQTAGRIKK